MIGTGRYRDAGSSQRAWLGMVSAFAALVFGLAVAGICGEAIKLETSYPGIHRVTFEELATGGLDAAVPSGLLSLENLGQPVALHVDDGGDGVFGPGDWIEFLAVRLGGEETYYHPYSRSNVYVLRTDGSRPPVTLTRVDPSFVPPDRPGSVLHRTLHLEVDTLLMRFRPSDEGGHDMWYWHKISMLDEPFTLSPELPLLATGCDLPIRISLQLRGWSTSRADQPDHSVEVAVAGRRATTAEWDGETLHTIDLEVSAISEPEITISVPRRIDESGGTIVDVVLLDWIEVSYPQRAELPDSGQLDFDLTSGEGTPVFLDSVGTGDIIMIGSSGARAVLKPDRGAIERRLLVSPSMFGASVSTAAAADVRHPTAIAPFQRDDLLDPANRADYLMIVHPSLTGTARALADYRQRQGLQVRMVEIDQVYDAFNHGIQDPDAIRRLVAYARSSWRRPAPRFVILVGDASWDFKNDVADVEHYAFKPIPLRNLGVGRPDGWAYDQPKTNRGLIPAGDYIGHWGHTASDNLFVSVEGDDHLPDLAIGRLPVVSPDELEAVIAKIIAYERPENSGPWQTEALLITNEKKSFQDTADSVGELLTERGIAIRRVYPIAGEKGSTDRILAALNLGSFVTYFYGHGGRFIWETSPADWKNQRHLFRLEDVDRLQESSHLPVVLSFTCYSAPFDHPTEDSLGEKLLRAPGRGAIAVVGASWRNSPSVGLQRAMLTALLEAETVGEAVMAAKREFANRELIEMYNLLGDPATRLARPRQVHISAKTSRDQVNVTLPDADRRLSGWTGLIRLLGADGETLAERSVRGGDELELETGVEAELLQGAVVTVHLWDQESGHSVVGVAPVAASEPLESPTTR